MKKDSANTHLEGVIQSVERKLAVLERQHVEIKESIRDKEREIAELKNSLEALRSLEQQLPSSL